MSKGYQRSSRKSRRFHRGQFEVIDRREGMEETLTVHRLGVSALLRRSLASTNPIESCLSTVRRITRRVTRWRGGDQRARWTAAEKGFRRIKGSRDLGALVQRLNPSLHSQSEGA